jgi:hypothetical protein
MSKVMQWIVFMLSKSLCIKLIKIWGVETKLQSWTTKVGFPCTCIWLKSEKGSLHCYIYIRIVYRNNTLNRMSHMIVGNLVKFGGLTKNDVTRKFVLQHMGW